MPRASGTPPSICATQRTSLQRAGQLLTRGRPFIAAFPRVVTHAQAQLAVELAHHGIDVIIGAERATFAQLVDDPMDIDRNLVRAGA